MRVVSNPTHSYRNQTHGKTTRSFLEKDAAAARQLPRMAWDGGGGDEARSPSVGAEEPQHRGRAVELPKPAAEAGVGDETGPALADEGGAHEEMGLYLGEAEEDLLDELLHVHQGRRRHPGSLVAARGFRS